MKSWKEKNQAVQLFFPKSMYLEIKLNAAQKKKPAATWMKDVIQKELEKDKAKRPKFSDMPTFSFPELKPFKPEDIDKIVYKL